MTGEHSVNEKQCSDLSGETTGLGLVTVFTGVSGPYFHWNMRC